MNNVSDLCVYVYGVCVCVCVCVYLCELFDGCRFNIC